MKGDSWEDKTIVVTTCQNKTILSETLFAGMSQTFCLDPTNGLRINVPPNTFFSPSTVSWSLTTVNSTLLSGGVGNQSFCFQPSSHYDIILKDSSANGWDTSTLTILDCSGTSRYTKTMTVRKFYFFFSTFFDDLFRRNFSQPMATKSALPFLAPLRPSFPPSHTPSTLATAITTLRFRGPSLTLTPTSLSQLVALLTSSERVVTLVLLQHSRSLCLTLASSTIGVV